MTTEQILFALLRSQICGDSVSQEVKAAITPEIIDDLYESASVRGFAHIIGQELSRLGLLEKDEISERFQKSMMDAVARYIKTSSEYYSLCNVLEEAKIPYIPLKGSVIRDWYPEPWMRTSADIDILIKKDDIEAVAKNIEEKLGYRRVKNESHDVAFFSPTGVYFELHFDLIEDSISEVQCAVLTRIWDVVYPAPGHQYKMLMPMSWFRLYHIAHMAKHIKYAGCGVRAFLDLWLIDHCAEYDVKECEELLLESDLSVFGNTAKLLSEHWFSNMPADKLSIQLGRYVLGSGLLGTTENKILVRQGKGKMRYVLLRIFKPYSDLSKMYPVIIRHKWLYPLCQLHRWLHILTNRRLRKYTVWELTEHAKTTEDDIRDISNLLRELEL